MRGRSVIVLLYVLGVASVGNGLPSRRLQQLPASPAGDVEAYRMAGCDNFTSDQWQPLRPGYHITVPYGWMNDPHGLFQLNGTTHLFFQYNPVALQWGAPFWGHVVSQDLVHWTWTLPALLPDQFYDRNGVWSGSATIQDGGVPVLTYTAAGTSLPEMGNFFQQQALAVPEDLSDPLLKKWKKSNTNPFLSQVPPGGTNFQFRDPTEARDAVWSALTSPDNPSPMPKHYYALAVGSQAFCMGGAGIFAAPSMEGPWSYVGSLYNQLDIEPQINGQCMAARTTGNSSWPAPAYGGPCDQFGAFCRMWEVVDFLELEPGVWMIKWDDQSRFRELFSMEWYVLGNGPWDYSALHPKHAGIDTTAATTTTDAPGTDAASISQKPPRKVGPAATSSSSDAAPGVFGQQYSTYPNSSRAVSAADSGSSNMEFNYIEAGVTAATKSLFKGELDGQKFAPMRTDYGSLYASTVFRAQDSRQIMFSWILETAAGCADSCSDQLPKVIEAMGFKGVQTLPRHLLFDKATKTLRAYPVEEVALLRGALLYNASAAPVAALPGSTFLVPDGVVPGTSAARAAAATNRDHSSGANISASSTGGSSSSSVTARQLEVQMNFTLTPHGVAATNKSSSSNVTATASSTPLHLQPDEFAAGVRVSTGNGTYVDVFLKGSVGQVAASPGLLSIASLSVWVDRSKAGGATNTSYMEGGPVPLPVNNTWLVPQQSLGLSVWVDHSVLEVFAMGGLARVTSRIYPTGDDVAWGVAAWSVPPKAVHVAAAAADGTVGAGGAGSSAGGASGTGSSSFGRKVYCWWCKLWFRNCSCQCEVSDARCQGEKSSSSSSASSTSSGRGSSGVQVHQPAPELQEWVFVADGKVWEVSNAWLPPSC